MSRIEPAEFVRELPVRRGSTESVPPTVGTPAFAATLGMAIACYSYIGTVEPNVTMPNKLFVTLLLTLPFAACSDSARPLTVANSGPAAPINDPDTQVIEPTPEIPGGLEGESGSNPNTSGLPVSNGNETGTGLPGSGGTAGSSNQGGSGNGSNEGNVGNSNNGPGNNGGGQSGSPVPEPGTLLLFGSGLAGLAGFSLRRRRRED